MKAKEKNGFTLIELIIVFGVLSIFITMLVPSLKVLPIHTRNQVDQTNARLLFEEIQANVLVEDLILETNDKVEITNKIEEFGIYIPVPQNGESDLKIILDFKSINGLKIYFIEIEVDETIIFSKELE